MNRGLFFIPATKSATKFDQNMPIPDTSFPYKLAKLRDRNGDLSKRWYIEFYVWDIAIGKLIRKVDYEEINTFRTAKERIKSAASRIREINLGLISGLVFNSADTVELDTPVITNEITAESTLEKCFKFASQSKLATSRARTAHTHDSFNQILISVFKELKIINYPLRMISPEIIHKVMDVITHRPIKGGKKISNRTFNNYLDHLTGYFNFFVRRELIDKNPCRTVLRLGEGTGRNLAYSNDQKSKLLEAFDSAGYLELSVFCRFIYYTLARPNELRQVQVKHLEKEFLFIPGSNSKNRNDRTPILANQLKDLIDKLGWRNYPGEYFVFGPGCKPSKSPRSVSYYTNKHREFILALGFGNDFTLYSWKHSGTCDGFKAGIDIRRLQLQIGHSSINDTMTYLKSLNLLNDKDLSGRFPDLPL